MRRTGAPNLTAAIRRALQNEIRRADAAVPLAERVRALRARALAATTKTRQAPLTEAKRDDLWGA
ncbi:antitoxin VapB [Methylobacterium sp. PvR107]|nr:antitoxin VapB [Methylobacterium sp. PvR107]